MLRLLIYVSAVIVIYFLLISKKEYFTFGDNENKLYDKIFDNVIYYPNKYSVDTSIKDNVGKFGYLQRTGYDLCKEKCDGNCVEYGVTGNTYCFTKKNI